MNTVIGIGIKFEKQTKHTHTQNPQSTNEYEYFFFLWMIHTRWRWVNNYNINDKNFFSFLIWKKKLHRRWRRRKTWASKIFNCSIYLDFSNHLDLNLITILLIITVICRERKSEKSDLMDHSIRINNTSSHRNEMKKAKQRKNKSNWRLID